MKIKIDMYYEVLTDRIRYFKEDEEWQLCAKLVTDTSAAQKECKIQRNNQCHMVSRQRFLGSRKDE